MAEQVVVPVGSQGSDADTPALPRRGTLKPEVREQLGAPKERRSAVGDPPISSWVYDGFTVYFEYDHVIHSVVDHKPRNTASRPGASKGTDGP